MREPSLVLRLTSCASAHLEDLPSRHWAPSPIGFSFPHDRLPSLDYQGPPTSSYLGPAQSIKPLWQGTSEAIPVHEAELDTDADVRRYVPLPLEFSAGAPPQPFASDARTRGATAGFPAMPIAPNAKPQRDSTVALRRPPLSASASAARAESVSRARTLPQRGVASQAIASQAVQPQADCEACLNCASKSDHRHRAAAPSPSRRAHAFVFLYLDLTHRER